MTEIRHKVLGTVGAAEKKEVMTEVDLKSLIELGCIKDVVKIGGFEFTIRSLSTTERFELSKEFGDKEQLSNEDQFNFNVKLLSFSIESVNGKPLEDLHPNEQDIFKAKMEIISALQTPVISKLLEFCSSIMQRCDAQFSAEQVKN